MVAADSVTSARSGGPMLQSTKKPDTRSSKATTQGLSPDERAWVQEYRRHLDRLYEPPADLPSDLDQLVQAVARRIEK
jgi:hypothetical protein